MDAGRRSFALTAGAVLVAQAQRPGGGPGNAQVRVESVRRIFHNGEHDAFTDLIKFNGAYYLTFRTCPDGHMVHPTSAIIVLASVDGASDGDGHVGHCG
jgi:hypothetical protein